MQAHASTGKIALEGEFLEGLKEGIWLQYSEEGRLQVVKFFDHGVEKTPPDDIRKKIDLLIQQRVQSK